MGFLALVASLLFPLALAVEEVPVPEQPDPLTGALPDVRAGEPEHPLGKFRMTYYYVAVETDYPQNEPRNETLKTMSDEPIASVTRVYKRALAIEGSGKLADGRVVSFSGVKEKEVRYSVVDVPYGYGVGNCALDPFRTVAVDPKLIPQGAVVRIAETVGMKLPDGTVHDGLWKAEDIGGAIQKDRIDLFVGLGERQGDALARHGLRNLQPLSVSLVHLPEEDSCVHQADRPW